MSNYELMLVLSPDVDEEKTQAALERVNGFITGQGGSISKEEKWGKRRLTYPIRHFNEANYIVTQFTLSPSSTKELERTIHLTEGVIRHLLVKAEG